MCQVNRASKYPLGAVLAGTQTEITRQTQIEITMQAFQFQVDAKLYLDLPM